MKAVKGYAKINLHLDVTGIMADGYHSVQTVMQSLSLCDEVSVTLRDEPIFDAECNVDGVPTDEKNIAVRAARLYFEKVGKTGGAHIAIEKNIPMAAGLAGGSADAAAVLVALDAHFGEILGEDELCKLGASLGADVPFCISCGTKYSDGRGDILHDFPKLSDDLIFLVACGGEGVSTPWGYRLLDETFDRFADYVPKGTDALRSAIEAEDKHAFCGHIFNIFE
jgi:4-diphosphocytidyl-2-C-methyl-D-erythritol kinase